MLRPNRIRRQDSLLVQYRISVQTVVRRQREASSVRIVDRS